MADDVGLGMAGYYLALFSRVYIGSAEIAG